MHRRVEDPSEERLPTPGGGWQGILSLSASFSGFSRKLESRFYMKSLHFKMVSFSEENILLGQ